MKKIIILSLIILAMTTSINAQGEYSGKGTSAVGFAYGLAFDDGEKASSLQLGYSIDGIFDMNIGFVENRYGEQVASIGGTYHIFNSPNTNKFKLAILGVYLPDNETISGSTVLHTDLHLGGYLFLKPFGGVGIIDRGRSANVSYQFGLDFYIKNNKSIFSFSPQVVRFLHETNFGIQVGIIFPMK